jgi:hypothetical protein
MTRTSKALKRLGVAGLVAVTVGAGLPALIATGAQAAGPVTQIALAGQPDNQGAAGSCIAYQATAKDATGTVVPGATITVTITDSSTSSTRDVNFCTLPTTNGTTVYQPQTGNVVSDQGPQPTGGGRDTAVFTADANGVATFGVTATSPGAVGVLAFYDVNGDKAFSAGEPNASDTANFTQGGPAGSNTNQDAATTVSVTPVTDNAVVGETRNFVVHVTNGSGDALNGVIVSYASTPPGVGQGQTYGPTTCGSTDNNGDAICKIAFNTVGTDNLTFYVNQTQTGGTPGPDASEPKATATETVTAAPTGRTVTLAPKNRNVDYRSASATYTVTVTNTSSGTTTTTAGTLLSFSITGGSPKATVTPTECQTTGNSPAGTSTCPNITVSDPGAVAGEVITVTATVRGTSSTDTATMTVTNNPTDARNIALSPKTQTVTPGSGIGALTATVTDVNGKPVPNVWVTFSESGPGRFVNTAGSSFNIQTDANGKATVEVNATSSESGNQTITAAINENFTGATQCSAKAGQNAAGGTLAAPDNTTARAGNCSDTATVTYGAASPSPTTSPTSNPTFSCTQGAVLSITGLDPIVVGARSTVRLTATPGDIVEIDGYSRPSQTSRVLRNPLSVPASGVLDYSFTPRTNSRLFAISRRGCQSSTLVLHVRAKMSLQSSGSGRTFTFSGAFLPAAENQGRVVSIYYTTSRGQFVKAKARVRGSGYSVTTTFTTPGTYTLFAHVGNDSNNLANNSNNRVTVRVR